MRTVDLAHVIPAADMANPLRESDRMQWEATVASTALRRKGWVVMAWQDDHDPADGDVVGRYCIATIRGRAHRLVYRFDGGES